jgi:predicted O-methyltransferase YrrM
MESIAALITAEREASRDITDRAILGDVVHSADEGQWFLTNDNIYVWYYAIGKVLAPRRIAEIGTRTGYSLKAMLEGSGLPPSEVRIWSYDAELNIPNSQTYCRDYFAAHGYSGSFRHVYTQTILSLRIAEPVDLVHVDALHTEEGCYHECVMGIEALKDGAT